MINQQDFIQAFNNVEKMPKDKTEFMERLFYFWKIGGENRETEIKNSIQNAFNKLIIN
jgi:hypothetical protein